MDMELFTEILDDVKEAVETGAINQIIGNGCPYDIITLHNLIFHKKYAINDNGNNKPVINLIENGVKTTTKEEKFRIVYNHTLDTIRGYNNPETDEKLLLGIFNAISHDGYESIDDIDFMDI